jgi:hypothetical protein
MRTDPFPELPAGAEDSLPRVWSRNRGAIMLVGCLTVASSLTALLISGHVGVDSLLLVCRVQLWVMAVLVPAVLVSATGRLDALVRPGGVTDAFGVFLLAVALFTPALTVLRAAFLYLILLSVMVLGAGLFTTLRTAGLWRVPSAVLVGLVILGLGAGAWLPLPGRIDVDKAVRVLLQLDPSAVDWLVTLMVLATTAGLVWTGGYLVQYHRAGGSM